MLFTDTDFISSPDLIALDPEVTQVAKAESLLIDSPTGIGAMAGAEVAEKLLLESQAFSGFNPPYAMPYNQTAAVLNLVGPSINRSRISLSQVCVSSSYASRNSSLKIYGVYWALVMFYRAAFYKKANDRYDKKRLMYEEEIRKRYWPRFYNQGIPIVYKPLACPGALHEANAGVWDATRASLAAGTNANADTPYDVAISWVDNTKYVSQTVKGNAESCTSAVIAGFNITQNNVLRLDITPLNPPNGTNPINVALGQGLVIPGNASGWNVYVGTPGGTLYLQNATPIPIATKTYTMTGPPVLSGFQSDLGQYVDAFLTAQRTLMRG